MEYSGRLLLLLAIALSLTAANDIAAAQPRTPGFLFTRTRGSCTPQYWSSRPESWPKMVPHTSTVSRVFGSRAFERYRSNLTLLEASSSRNHGGEDAFSSLVRQSTAALLNSYSRKGYPYGAWEIKTLFIQALVSESAAASQALRFLQANEDCV